MPSSDVALLIQALSRLREIDKLLEGADAGVCVVHLMACIAALESRIAKLGAAVDVDSAADVAATQVE